MESSIVFFKVERNDLNNQYMVHSECEQLPQAFAYERKSEAKKANAELNVQANKEYNEKKIVITWKEPVSCK